MAEVAFLPDLPRYAVSRCGRVFSFNADGRCKDVAVHVHRAHPAATPYRMVTLSRGGKPWTVKVAKLLMLAFGTPQPSPDHCICHADGDSLNDTVGNLRWGTYTDNNRDRIGHGTIPRGEAHKRAKLTAAAVAAIRSPENAGRRLRELAAEFGVSETQISNIRRGKQWAAV